MANNPAANLAINLIFGLSSTAISVVTAYQGYKLWRLMRQTTNELDIELGTHAAADPPGPSNEDANPSDDTVENGGTLQVEATRGRDRSRRRNINTVNGGEAA